MFISFLGSLRGFFLWLVMGGGCFGWIFNGRCNVISFHKVLDGLSAGT